MSATTLQAPALRVAAAPVGGAILAKWNSLGGAGGPLGAVQGGDLVCPDRVGHFVHVANGSIYWTPATGAAWVRGPILVKWGLLGWERCALGYPVSDETGCPDGVGRFSHFQSGSIYWTPVTGAFSVHGPIRDRWASLGWERSALGYPVSDEGDLAGGGRVGTFQHGRICWTAATGAWVEMGASVPPQLDHTFSAAVLGGFAQLTIRRDGGYVFSGHLHGPGETSCSTSLVCVVKDTLNRAYTFARSGEVTGTFERGSRDDDWNVAGVNAAICANWASLVGGTSAARAAAGPDVASLGGAVLTALGVVVQVIPVTGTAFGSGAAATAGKQGQGSALDPQRVRGPFDPLT